MVEDGATGWSARRGWWRPERKGQSVEAGAVKEKAGGAGRNGRRGGEPLERGQERSVLTVATGGSGERRQHKGWGRLGQSVRVWARGWVDGGRSARSGEGRGVRAEREGRSGEGLGLGS